MAQTAYVCVADVLGKHSQSLLVHHPLDSYGSLLRVQLTYSFKTIKRYTQFSPINMSR